MQLLFEQSDEVTPTKGLGFSRGVLNALVVAKRAKHTEYRIWGGMN